MACFRKFASLAPVGVAVALCIVSVSVPADDAEESAWRAAVETASRLTVQDEVTWMLNNARTGTYSQDGDALPVIDEGLQSDEPAARLRALEGLARIGGASAPAPFVEALSDSNPDIQAFAARVLADCDPKELLDSIIRLMASPPERTAPDWGNVLPHLREPLEEPMISALLSDQTTRPSRLAVVYALGCMRSTAAIQELVKAAETDDPELALCCAESLYRICDPAVIPALVRLAGHPSARVRWTAVEGLAALNAPMAMNALGEIACAPPADDTYLGEHALSLLGATADGRVVPILIDVMRRNLNARAAAVAMLRKITREDLGDLPSDWAQWYDEQQRKLNQPVQTPEKPLFDVELGP
jgi:HEAT repeat protein